MLVPMGWPRDPGNVLHATFPVADRAGVKDFIELARTRCRVCGRGAPVISTRRRPGGLVAVTIVPVPEIPPRRPLAQAAWIPGGAAVSR